MKLKCMRNILFSHLILLIIYFPIKTDALIHDWIAVPSSQYGEQLWDKNSFQKNQDSSIRVFSKFIPKRTTKITKEILYTMDIDCSNKSFKDVAIGQKTFNKFKSKNSEWQSPNGDKLILGIIDQVCTFDSNKNIS